MFGWFVDRIQPQYRISSDLGQIARVGTPRREVLSYSDIIRQNSHTTSTSEPQREPQPRRAEV